MEKILEAETAVDHKTELHSASSSTGPVSVCTLFIYFLYLFNNKLFRKFECCGLIFHTPKRFYTL